MSDLYGILTIGRDALLTQQTALQVTGNNIANATTPGYSRQRVVMETGAPIVSGSGVLGTGVRAARIERVYDRFTEAQITGEKESLGLWQARREALERVEMVFDESDGYGLNQAMSEFWNAWQDLTAASDPAATTERRVLVAEAETLAETFNRMASQLEQIQEDLDTRIEEGADGINRIAGQIADLNGKIYQVESGGQPANDFRDKRTQLLNELAGFIDFDMQEDDGGRITITLGDGNELVGSSPHGALSTVENAGAGRVDLQWELSDGTLEDIDPATISGGKLGGWLGVRDEVVPEYAGQLDDLARTIAEEVNAIHAGGLDLNGDAGEAFFQGASASEIAVNANIIADPAMIAAAGDEEGVPGGRANANAISELQYGNLMNGTATFDAFYRSLVSQVGGDLQSAQSNEEHQEAMVQILENYRESVSGVSLDEEMVNLVRFQHAYQAAARLISTADELFDSLMGMI